MQVFRDLLVGPVPGGKHGDGKLRGGQIIRHIVPGDRVMNSTPSGRETVGDVDDSFKILWLFGFNDRLQHCAQQAVMFSEAFDEIIGPGNFPRCQKMGLGPVRLL